MKLIFDGKILVTAANVEEGKSYLVLEQDRGSGNVGEFTIDSDRQAGCEIVIDEVAEDSVVLEFSKPESIAVVMEKLQQCLMHQLKMPA